MTHGRPAGVNTSVIEDMCARARQRGIDDSNPVLRPSNGTLSKVALNFAPNGKFQYLHFEEFVSQELEEQARLNGLIPKAGFQLVRADTGELRGSEQAPSLQTQWIDQQISLQQAQRLKEMAFDICGVCPADVLREFHTVQELALRESPLPGNRACTVSEVKLFDRHVHTEIMKILARGQGSMSQGITYFLSPEGAKEKEWTLLQQVDSSKADRGMIKPLKSSSLVVAPEGYTPKPQGPYENVMTAAPKTTIPHTPPPLAPGKGKGKGSALCKHCGLARSSHPNNSFDVCNQKAAALGQETPKPSGTNRASKKAKLSDAIPEALKHNCARKTPPTKEHPSGRGFCFDYHGIPSKQGLR